MTQAALFIVIFLAGLMIAMGLAAPERPHLACAMAFPLGLAMAALLALALLGIGIPYNAGTLGAAVALPTAASAVVWWRRGISRRQLVIAAAWTAAFSSVALALSTTNLAIMTFDSHTLVMLGRVVGQDAGFEPGTLRRLYEWGSFQVVAQSMTVFTQQDFLYALPPVFGVSSLVFFATTLWHAADAAGGDRRSRLVVVLVAIALSSSYMIVRNVFYLQTNFPTAIYLFGYAGLFWIAEQENNPSLLVPTFVMLLAFSLQRVETPLLALVFQTLTIFVSKLPRGAITKGVVGHAIAVAAWYELLAHHVPSDMGFLTPTRCRLVAAGMLGFAGCWLLSARPALQRLSHRLPAVAEYFCALALAAAFAMKPDHMVLATATWIQSLTELPEWGWTWYFVVALAGFGLLLPAPRFRQSFVRGIPITLAMILLISLLRAPYRFSPNDSGNRMALHVLPLVFFYLGLKLAVATRAPEPSESPS